ncbi:MAG TPA: hypothetical protein TECP_00690 [Hyphomicrobiaceae bacterium MAG_BT-2024]
MISGFLSFMIGSWLGNAIWPGSFILGAILGALLISGLVLCITSNSRQK